MKIVATLSTVLLALAATPPATADSIDQPPDVDGNISSHFVNAAGFIADTVHVGMRPGVRGLVDASNPLTHLDQAFFVHNLQPILVGHIKNVDGLKTKSGDASELYI